AGAFARPARHRPRARGEADLRLARCRGEFTRHSPAGCVDPRPRVAVVPASGRAPTQHGPAAFRWRATDVGAWAGLDDQSAPADPRRSHRGAGTTGARGNLALPGSAPR